MVLVFALSKKPVGSATLSIISRAYIIYVKYVTHWEHSKTHVLSSSLTLLRFEGILKWQNVHKSFSECSCPPPGSPSHLCLLRGRVPSVPLSGIIYPGNSITKGLPLSHGEGTPQLLQRHPWPLPLRHPSPPAWMNSLKSALGSSPGPAFPSFAPYVILILSHTSNRPFT